MQHSMQGQDTSARAHDSVTQREQKKETEEKTDVLTVLVDCTSLKVNTVENTQKQDAT